MGRERPEIKAHNGKVALVWGLFLIITAGGVVVGFCFGEWVVSLLGFVGMIITAKFFKE